MFFPCFYIFPVVFRFILCDFIDRLAFFSPVNTHVPRQALSSLFTSIWWHPLDWVLEIIFIIWFLLQYRRQRQCRCFTLDAYTYIYIRIPIYTSTRSFNNNCTALKKAPFTDIFLAHSLMIFFLCSPRIVIRHPPPVKRLGDSERLKHFTVWYTQDQTEQKQ